MACPDRERKQTMKRSPQAAYGWRGRIVRTAAGFLSPRGARARLAILIYHRVRPQIDPLHPFEVDRARFDWQMGLLARAFNVLPLEQAVQRLVAGTLPPRAVCVTFDDGYLDNHDVALPVLSAWRIPATFFVSTGYLDGGYMWNDVVLEIVEQAVSPALDLTPLGLGTHPIGDVAARRRVGRFLLDQLKPLEPEKRLRTTERLLEVTGTSPPRNIMMCPEHVRALANAGMTIGAHTVSHPVLSRVTLEAARQEIARGRERLEEIIGKRVSLFAYPHGRPGNDYRREHVDLVRDLGFEAAVSTAWGVATRATSRFELPRFTPWDVTPGRFAARFLHNYLRAEASFARA
jgi:peptidoglycan/xylan/chitin deacetylase (PgdA/CDA1 family)